MKKIAIDARMIDHSGIGTLLKNILSRLPKTGNLDISLIGRRDQLDKYGLSIIEADYPIYGIKEQLLMPGLLRKNDISLYHATHYNVPVLFGGKMIANIHDLIHLVFPHFLPSKAAYLYSKFLFAAACRKSKKIITISEHTKNDIIDQFKTDPSKIEIIYPGVSADFSPSAEKASAMKKIYGKYILYVGAVRPHKNVLKLVEAFILLKKSQNIEHKLIIIGKSKPEYLRQINRILSENLLKDEVLHFENAEAGNLVDFYCGAELFAFPSLYEGFGLPPLEAMACGCPVVTSNVSSLPEVVGNAALTVNPDCAEDISSVIHKMISNDNLRKELISKGLERAKIFSWEKAAERTMKIYEELTA
ncbi:MAG: glycosyltransferase family 1 protein [Elusimicrobiota bacterium]